MSVYVRQIATAQRLIAKYGQAVTWRQVRNAAPVDPAQPWNVANAAPVNYPVKVVFLPPGGQAQFIALMKETEIPEGTVQGLMAAVSFKPSVKDVVIRDNVELTIHSIDEIAPNGETILYTVIFKQ